MSKKLILGLVLLVAAAGIGGFLFINKDNSPEAAADTAAKTKPACLAKDDSITLSSEERNTIELVALGELTTVPAGTQVDVNIATHSDTRTTGSDIYPKNYGTYNFVMTRKAVGQDWHISEFVACQQ